MQHLIKVVLSLTIIGIQHVSAQAPNMQKTETDGDWAEKRVTLQNTSEADWMIRIGDIDNLNYGWTKGFSPFTEVSTGIHPFPWDIDPTDPPGTDRIFVPSSYIDALRKGYVDDWNCPPDGYSETPRKPDLIMLPLMSLKKTKIVAAKLQFFIDDFQQKAKCSRFQVKLNNNVRLSQMEDMLRYIDQSGPTGKLISITLNEEQLALLQDKDINILTILIDDTETKAGDGFAIDFVKLLINPKENIETGMLSGQIIDEITKLPIENAVVKIQKESFETNSSGNFSLKNIPIGYTTVEVSAKGYARKTEAVDISSEKNTADRNYIIELAKEKGVEINGSLLKEGEKITLNNMQFERTKYELLPNAKKELDHLYKSLINNPLLEIELSGHTSNEGLYSENVLLSKNRAEACRNYLLNKGIHPDRVKAIGYGPDQPLNENKTEAERIQNRRVEVKVLRMY